MTQARDWSPFRVISGGEHAPAPRSIHTRDGIGDRLRAAAFAEIQARDAFEWAAAHFDEAAPELKQAWLRLAKAEQRHLNWLLNRMTELGIGVSEREVSDRLWISFIHCKSACEFARFMASAEERGRKAGERFHEQLAATDPATAEIFAKIAREEIEHIALAARFFPDAGPETRPDAGSASALAVTPSA